MKKLMLLGVLLIAAVSLVACEGYETGDYVGNGDFVVIGDTGNMDVLKDVETGCEYLQPHNATPLSPYLNEDGEPRGCGEPVDSLNQITGGD